ncbi:MAG TPA: RNA 2',3'-cyclic phosphodiesterase [Candidatus Nanoarchaeia archaeon]|nr:RNA 2',3'-cyclic phosphodiesterase [uncultured archaeon]
MKLRLFVAVAVSTRLDSRIDQLNQQNSSPKFRLTKKENFHLTLFFLGYVEEKLLEKIKSILTKIAKETKPFALSIDRIDLAPPQGAKRMIWVYFDKNEVFTKLAKTVYGALSEFTKEELKWDPIPHVTLARSKKTLKTPDFEKVVLSKESLAVNSLRLYRSQPTRAGSNYTVLAKFLLRKN